MGDLMDAIGTAIGNSGKSINPNQNVTPAKSTASRFKNFAANTGSNSGDVDYIGIVIAKEGSPLTDGDIASRIGGFKDIEDMESKGASDEDLIAAILKTKNNLHNNYQDPQAFRDNGGQIGMQHDPLLFGSYRINPSCFAVTLVPMLVVEQGEVAVIKAYVGGKEIDESGKDFKFGTLVKPGRRGVWITPLRTGKYAINPKCYEAVKVKTSIINLNWADAISSAHQLDARLSSIRAKSKEGFEVVIDLQVQIHIPDTQASRVISSVGTMENLIDDILQAAVGNHFRDRLQAMSAVSFIEDRQKIQEEAFIHIKDRLSIYGVETVGVYIQNVIYPEDLIQVLKNKEIANQQKEMYKTQEDAENQRISMAAKKGTADKQADLAASEVGIAIAKNKADARIKEAEGESKYTEQVGRAEAAVIEAKQKADAAGYLEKAKALGPANVAMIEAVQKFSESQKGQKLLPEIFISGGGGALDGVLASLMKFLTVPGNKEIVKNAIDSVKDSQSGVYSDIDENDKKYLA